MTLALDVELDEDVDDDAVSQLLSTSVCEIFATLAVNFLVAIGINGK